MHISSPAAMSFEHVRTYSRGGPPCGARLAWKHAFGSQEWFTRDAAGKIAITVGGTSLPRGSGWTA